jgi:hypothetical protein
MTDLVFLFIPFPFIDYQVETQQVSIFNPYVKFKLSTEDVAQWNLHSMHIDSQKRLKVFLKFPDRSIFKIAGDTVLIDA